MATEYSHDEPGAGMEHQRQIGQTVDHVGERRHRIEDLALVVGLEDRCARIEQAVAEAGRVAQQMANGDRPLRRFGVVDRRRARPQHLAVSELRDEGLDRIVEPEAAFLDQQQRRAGGDQLGVGEDAEDVIGAQRNLRFLVGPSDAARVSDVAPDQNRPGDAGQEIVVDVALHGRARRREIIADGRHLQIFHGRFPCCAASLLSSRSSRDRGQSRGTEYPAGNAVACGRC
ncbi:hypothetical protein ACVIM9_002477 [Bradyrhizobium sp. USDA 4520]